MTIAESNSNDVRFLQFDDGRTLIAKEPRHPELSRDLLAERTASRLLRDHPDVLAPEHLPVDRDGDDVPLVAYWIIPHPTLEDVWPAVADTRRADTLRSWGRLMRRLHDVRLPGHGRLPEALHGTRSLGGFLADDLEGRLRPAVQADWPGAVGLVDRLIGAMPSAVDGIGDGDPVLVH
ncbi:MAG TPA: phosphotransferase, partial [Arenibaculum sp.]|nr:phosphotransferase [Arenibaculum sp.]